MAHAAQADDRVGGEVTPGDATRIAAVFRVLADPSRCRLVYALLRGDEICVGELAERLGMSESNVSHHLSVLRAHGIVRFRRAGKQVFYDEPAGPGGGRLTSTAPGDPDRS